MENSSDFWKNIGPKNINEQGGATRAIPFALLNSQSLQSLPLDVYCNRRIVGRSCRPLLGCYIENFWVIGVRLELHDTLKLLAL